MGSFTIAEFNEIVRKKINDFKLEYGEKPKYLKVPLATYNGLILVAQMGVLRGIEFDRDIVRYENLILCPTISITTNDEIEVF